MAASTVVIFGISGFLWRGASQSWFRVHLGADEEILHFSFGAKLLEYARLQIRHCGEPVDLGLRLCARFVLDGRADANVVHVYVAGGFAEPLSQVVIQNAVTIDDQEDNGGDAEREGAEDELGPDA